MCWLMHKECGISEISVTPEGRAEGHTFWEWSGLRALPPHIKCYSIMFRWQAIEKLLWAWKSVHLTLCNGTCKSAQVFSIDVHVHSQSWLYHLCTTLFIIFPHTTSHRPSSINIQDCARLRAAAKPPFSNATITIEKWFSRLVVHCPSHTYIKHWKIFSSLIK